MKRIHETNGIVKWNSRNASLPKFRIPKRKLLVEKLPMSCIKSRVHPPAQPHSLFLLHRAHHISVFPNSSFSTDAVPTSAGVRRFWFLKNLEMGKWDRRWVPRRRNYSKKYRDFDYEESPPSPPSPHHPQSNPPRMFFSFVLGGQSGSWCNGLFCFFYSFVILLKDWYLSVIFFLNQSSDFSWCFWLMCHFFLGKCVMSHYKED